MVAKIHFFVLTAVAEDGRSPKDMSLELKAG
jgi:hypothetical protein